MNFDLKQIANFKKVIEDIVNVCIQKKGITTYTAAIVVKVNDNNTVNVKLPPENKRYITNVINKTGEELNVGDSVEICTKNGRLSNSWVAIKHGTNLDPINPVGTVIMTSENVNPGNKLQGTWKLIDKEFSSRSFDVNDNIITPGDKISNFACYVVRSGHSYAIRLDFRNTEALGDTTVDLCTFDFKTLGVSRIYMNSSFIFGGTDGGNGYALCGLNWRTAVFQSYDVVRKDGSNSIPADSVFTIYFTLVSRYDYMLDEACDRFYWKRIS